MVLGRAPAGLSPGAQRFMDFLSLIYENFRPRWVKMPVFSDEALKRVTMPVLAIVGGRDVLLDSAETKRRLEQVAAHAEIRYYPEMATSSQGRRRRFWTFWGVRQRPFRHPSSISGGLWGRRQPAADFSPPGRQRD